MISDFQILGIEETQDRALIKSAFRRRAKELHPDLSGAEDPLARHDLFVEVCKAYRRLVGGLETQDGAQGAAGPGMDQGSLAPTPHADRAYAFYKAGMRQFMMIHPSHWNLGTDRMLNTSLGVDDEDQARIRQRIIELVKLFPKAYNKMGKIEKRIGMYRHSIESFSAWNRDRNGPL